MRFVIFSLFLIGCGDQAVFRSLEGGAGPVGEGGTDTVSVGGTGGTFSSGGMGAGGDVPVPCDGECILPNAASICQNDQCVIDHCLQGFSNCNNQTSDGCEVDTGSDLNNCGTCGKLCEVEGSDPNGGLQCQAGNCVLLACAEPTYGKCSEDSCTYLVNNDQHCGECDNACVNGAVCAGPKQGSNLVASCGCPMGPDISSNDQSIKDCHNCLKEKCCNTIKACENNSDCWSQYTTWASCAPTNSCGSYVFPLLEDLHNCYISTNCTCPQPGAWGTE